MAKELQGIETTKNIKIPNVPYEVYQYLKELKDKGNFSDWTVFVCWLTTNKPITEIVIDEILKRMRVQGEEKR